MEYNPFPAVDGCAKLPWFRRGLRFTVSLRIGVIFFGGRKTADFFGGRKTADFLGDRSPVREVFGSDTAAVECGRKTAGILRNRSAAQKFFHR